MYVSNMEFNFKIVRYNFYYYCMFNIFSYYLGIEVNISLNTSLFIDASFKNKFVMELKHFKTNNTSNAVNDPKYLECIE